MPRIVSVNVGEIESLPHGLTTVDTAIRKTPVDSPVEVTPTGLRGDHQADRRHHGGPDKALLLFSREQYPTLEHHIGREVAIPSFGENLTITGMTESEVCLGDVIRIGTTTLEVTQPRNPCYKQAVLHGVKDLVLVVERTGCTGWYVRVLEPGTLTAGDDLVLLDRPHPDASIALVNRVLHRLDDQAFDTERIGRLLIIPSLGGSLRDRLERLSHNDIEDPRRRREGPMNPAPVAGTSEVP